MIVRTATPLALTAMARATGLNVTGEFKGIEALDTHGIVQGVVGYDKWTHNAVRIHIWMNPHAARALLLPAFAYPFIQANKKVLIAEIAASNKKSRRLALHLGFHEVTRISDGWDDDDDLIIYTMRRETCRWIGKVD